MTFTELSTPRRIDESSFSIRFEDGWQQGKGMFGGLVLASMVRALDQNLAQKDRRLRALTAEIFAPAMVGEARLEVSSLRIGSGVSTLSCSLLQNGEPLARCVGLYGRARAAVPNRTPAAPRLTPWRDVPVALIGPPLAPRFSAFCEYRITGNLPFTGQTIATTDGWVRPRDPGPLRDAAYVVACADAYYPSSLVLETTPRPMSTIAFTLELLSDLEGLDPDAPLWHRGFSPASSDGYCVDFRELWGEDGRLVALNQQTFVVIK